MKRMLVIGGVIVAVLAVAVYRAKLGAEATEGRIDDLKVQKTKVSEQISVLKAEEAYLTRPERIGPIARDKLGLEPAAPSQYTAPEALSQRLGGERLTLPASPAPGPKSAQPKVESKAVKPAPTAEERPAQ